MRRPPPAPARGDAGISLIEVLVGVVIMGVLGGLLTTLVVDMLKTSSGTSSRLTNVDSSRVALDDLTRGLRTAVRPEQINAGCTSNCDSAFRSAGANEVTFYANYGVAGQARLTTYRVEADPHHSGTARLVEEIFASGPPGGSLVPACGTGCNTRVVARGLVWPLSASDPVFDFADRGCADFTATVALTDISCVLIDVPLAAKRDDKGTSATATVFLPNSVMGR
ncbi:MAG TPA: prepilin-type N-terminal cleavage/methylation domain-containing protein [Sporichthya sp.]|nr:prepilin-type N-terminal cleavage/methylation domain-containing protein [Sporichthya sp.]